MNKVIDEDSDCSWDPEECRPKVYQAQEGFYYEGTFCSYNDYPPEVWSQYLQDGRVIYPYILKASTSTPLESKTPSITSWNQTLSSHPTDSSTSKDSIWNPFTIWGTVIGSVILTAIILCITCCLGFASAGIKGGSMAADMMSYSAIANGGGVEAGGCVATCQSIGVLGICSLGCFPATVIIILGAGAGGLIGFGIGFGLNKLLNSITYYGPLDAPINSTVVNDAEHLLQFASNGNGEHRLNSKANEILKISYLENNITSSTASDLPLDSLLSDPPKSNNSVWNPFTMWGAVAGAVILTPISLCIPYFLGFAMAGVRMGSLAARMMSCSNGGNVVTGSCIAIFQSIGALGVCSLGFVPIAILISINAAIGFGIGYGVKQLNDLVYKNSTNVERATQYNTAVDYDSDHLYPDLGITGNGRGESRLDSKTLESDKRTSSSKQSLLTGSQTAETELFGPANQTETIEGIEIRDLNISSSESSMNAIKAENNYI